MKIKNIFLNNQEGPKNYLLQLSTWSLLHIDVFWVIYTWLKVYREMGIDYTHGFWIAELGKNQTAMKVKLAFYRLSMHWFLSCWLRSVFSTDRVRGGQQRLGQSRSLPPPQMLMEGLLFFVCLRQPLTRQSQVQSLIDPSSRKTTEMHGNLKQFSSQYRNKKCA